MDWIAQNWFAVLAVALAALLVLRLAVGIFARRSAPPHTGERTVRVVGVGGAGGNAVNEMIRARRGGASVDYVAINTDGQVLEESLADRRVRIGDQVTHGLGAGGDAELGRRAAEEDASAIEGAVTGADLVFVAAGLGGGTGSGAGPLVAANARAAGALTVGVVTMPFTFEGATRRRIAEDALEALRTNVDTLLVIENDRVDSMIADDTPLLEAFRVVNDVLGQTIRAIVDIMSTPGLINLDFADIRAVMKDGGTGLTGIGWADGEDRAVEAARKAITSPLLALDIRGARGLLLNVAGSSRLTLREVVRAAETVREASDPGAHMIFGATFDDRLKNEVRVTVIATRFGEAGAGGTAATAGPSTTTSPTAPAAPLDMAPSGTARARRRA